MRRFVRQPSHGARRRPRIGGARGRGRVGAHVREKAAESRGGERRAAFQLEPDAVVLQQRVEDVEAVARAGQRAALEEVLVLEARKQRESARAAKGGGARRAEAAAEEVGDLRESRGPAAVRSHHVI